MNTQHVVSVRLSGYVREHAPHVSAEVTNMLLVNYADEIANRIRAFASGEVHAMLVQNKLICAKHIVTKDEPYCARCGTKIKE